MTSFESGAGVAGRTEGVDLAMPAAAAPDRELIENPRDRALIEQVQRRIGRDLHEDLGQRLTAVAFLARALGQRLDPQHTIEREQAAWILQLVDEANERVRFLSRQLAASEGEEIALAPALQRLADDVQRIYRTRVTLHLADGAASIRGQAGNDLFRITQESISNAVRHGRATRIRVDLALFDQDARLAVLDNGCGFPASAPSTGQGLRNIAARASNLGGRSRFRSSRRGTVVIVRAPVGAQAAPA